MGLSRIWNFNFIHLSSRDLTTGFSKTYQIQSTAVHKDQESDKRDFTSSLFLVICTGVLRIDFYWTVLNDLGPKYISDLLRYEPCGTGLLTVPRVIMEKQQSVFMHHILSVELTPRKLAVCSNSQKS